MSDAKSTHDSPCDLRFGQVGLACVRAHDIDPTAIGADLERRVQAAPQMFVRTAVVLDLSHLPGFPEDDQVRALLDAIRDAGMLPVGLAYADTRTEALAERLQLPLIARFRAAFEPSARDKQPTTDDAPVDASPASDGNVSAQQHLQSVRSGQQIYARDHDLVITANVGHGAEVIADGSIHIYGTLRGRALAGAQGNENARIYCTDFQPELVSIAGHYRVFEEIPGQFAGQAVQCRLDGDKLLIEKL